MVKLVPKENAVFAVLSLKNSCIGVFASFVADDLLFGVCGSVSSVVSYVVSILWQLSDFTSDHLGFLRHHCQQLFSQ